MRVASNLEEGIVTLLETNHTTTINIYKLNYGAVILTLCCFLVFLFVLSCSLKGKGKQKLNPPVPLVYHLAKTANKPDHAKCCMVLIKNENYDVNHVSSDVKLSLFLCACFSGNSKLVSFMLQRGAKVHIKSAYGDSAFYLAVSRMDTNSSDFETLDILLVTGCDINSQNDDGFTALHLASSRGHKNLVLYLIQKGGDPTIPTLNDVLPRDLAKTNGYLELADYLQNVMANSTVTV